MILSASGDFDVPSSREDVDRDSMWNQWLVSEIHTICRVTGSIQGINCFGIFLHQGLNNCTK